MNRIPETIREAYACTWKALEAELVAFGGSFALDELWDDPSPEVVAAIRKAIAAHEDAARLLEAALPGMGRRRR